MTSSLPELQYTNIMHANTVYIFMLCSSLCPESKYTCTYREWWPYSRISGSVSSSSLRSYRAGPPVLRSGWLHNLRIVISPGNTYQSVQQIHTHVRPYIHNTLHNGKTYWFLFNSSTYQVSARENLATLLRLQVFFVHVTLMTRKTTEEDLLVLVRQIQTRLDVTFHPAQHVRVHCVAQDACALVRRRNLCVTMR